jgi:hypothetical protein
MCRLYAHYQGNDKIVKWEEVNLELLVNDVSKIYLMHSGDITWGKDYIKSNMVIGSVCRCIFKRSFLLNNKIKFNENVIHCEDSLFMNAVLLHTPKIKLVDCYYYYYFQRNGSAMHTNTYSAKLTNSHITYCIELQKLLENKANYLSQATIEAIVYRRKYNFYIQILNNEMINPNGLDFLKNNEILNCKYLDKEFYSQVKKVEGFKANVLFLLVRFKMFILIKILLRGAALRKQFF